jgi:hypothetical protein
MECGNYCKSCSVRCLQAIVLESITITFRAFVCVKCTFPRPLITIGTFIDPLVSNLFTSHDVVAFSLYNARKHSFSWGSLLAPRVVFGDSVQRIHEGQAQGGICNEVIKNCHQMFSRNVTGLER